MKIGLVIFKPFYYSETFFIKKINVLQQNGWQVTLFTQYSKSNQETSYPFHSALPTRPTSLYDFIIITFKLLKLLLFGLRPALRLYQKEKKRGATVIRALKRIYFNAHILTHKLDVIHFGYVATALERELVAESIRAKMAISLRGVDIAVIPLLYNKNCYQEVWKRVDHVHSISSHLYQKARKIGLSQNTPTTIIHPAIDLAQINTRLEPGTITSPLQIITVARLHWKKGYEYALIAIKKLIDQKISLHYNIIGSGESEQLIKYTIHDLGLEDHVTLSGQLEHQQVFEVMNSSHIYLQPSIQEGFCNAVLEAQATGLLTIATDAEGLNENIEHGKSGWLVPKRNPQAIANKIIEIIELPFENRKTVATYAINRIKKEFNLEKHKKEWSLFYNKIIK